ncbi:MAG: phosphatidylglycerol lysyltransferase domain-containing protein [Oscillospiraceae bacterium]|jgi:hypothetical protein|nr:phosphatidylglycerol lysyltransferase domain-containing protein [Oscillospiraceae bacterium]
MADIGFRPPVIEDAEWIRPLVYASGTRNADYSFANIFCWAETYRVLVARLGGALVTQMTIDGVPMYSFPLGLTDGAAVKSVVETLGEESRRGGTPLRLFAMSDADKRLLSELFPGKFRYSSDDGVNDYLYLAEKLDTLAGKKLHAKRNYINRFLSEGKSWDTEPISEGNTEEVLRTYDLWLGGKNFDPDAIAGEVISIRSALEHFPKLGLDGLVLRVDGKVAAFTIGEPLCEDAYVAHFEKALPDITGAYQLINREFAGFIRETYPNTVYVNREEDMGIENLRKAKHSYFPDIIEVKHYAESVL